MTLRGFSSSLRGGCLLIQQHLVKQAVCTPKCSDLLEAGCQNRQVQAPGHNEPVVQLLAHQWAQLWVRVQLLSQPEKLGYLQPPFQTLAGSAALDVQSLGAENAVAAATIPIKTLNVMPQHVREQSRGASLGIQSLASTETGSTGQRQVEG